MSWIAGGRCWSGVCSLQTSGPVPAWQQMRGQVSLGAAVVEPGATRYHLLSTDQQTRPPPGNLTSLQGCWTPARKITGTRCLTSTNCLDIIISSILTYLAGNYHQTIRGKTVNKTTTPHHTTPHHTDVWFGFNFLLPSHPDTMSGHENDYYFLQDAWQGWLLGE